MRDRVYPGSILTNEDVDEDAGDTLFFDFLQFGFLARCVRRAPHLTRVRVRHRSAKPTTPVKH